MPVTRSNPYSRKYRRQAYQTSDQRQNSTLRQIRRPSSTGHVIPLDSTHRAVVDYLVEMNHPWSAKLCAMPSGLSNPCRLIKVSFDFEVLPFRFTTTEPASTFKNVAVVMFGKPYDTTEFKGLKSPGPTNTAFNVVSLFGQRAFYSLVDSPSYNGTLSHKPIRTYGTINNAQTTYGPLPPFIDTKTGTGVAHGVYRCSLIGSGSPNLCFSGERTAVTDGELSGAGTADYKYATGNVAGTNNVVPLLSDGIFDTGIVDSVADNGTTKGQWYQGGGITSSLDLDCKATLEMLHSKDSLPAGWYCTTMLNPFSGSLPTASTFGGPATTIRSIAQGVQAYCTTPAEKRKGSVFLLELNGHQGVGDTTLSQLKSTQQDTVRRYPLAGVSGCHMTWHPQAPYDFVANQRGYPPGEVASLPNYGQGTAFTLTGDTTFTHDVVATLTNPTSTVPGQQTHTTADMSSAGLSATNDLYSTPTLSVSHAGGSVDLSATITLPSGTTLNGVINAAQTTQGQTQGPNTLVNFVGESAVGNFTNLMFFEDLDPTQNMDH